MFRLFFTLCLVSLVLASVSPTFAQDEPTATPTATMTPETVVIATNTPVPTATPYIYTNADVVAYQQLNAAVLLAGVGIISVLLLLAFLKGKLW
jgi:hypothetical protein